MPRYSVDLDAMTRLVDALRAASTGISAELEQLDAQVARLQGAWSGEAREAYALAQARWRAELAAIHRLLDLATARADGANARYTTARQTVAGRWGAA